MKKIATIAALSLLVFACSRKTVSTASTPTVTKTSKEDAAKAALEAHGLTIYTTKCARCHEAKDVTEYTTRSWEGILKSMIPKAKLTEEESRQVTAYVMAHAKKS